MPCRSARGREDAFRDGCVKLVRMSWVMVRRFQLLHDGDDVCALGNEGLTAVPALPSGSRDRDVAGNQL